LNGARVFQLAADGDSRVKLEGDVQLEIKPLRSPNFRSSCQSSYIAQCFDIGADERAVLRLCQHKIVAECCRNLSARSYHCGRSRLRIISPDTKVNGE